MVVQAAMNASGVTYMLSIDASTTNIVKVSHLFLDGFPLFILSSFSDKRNSGWDEKFS
jgi:hypothetical protein